MTRESPDARVAPARTPARPAAAERARRIRAERAGGRTGERPPEPREADPRDAAPREGEPRARGRRGRTSERDITGEPVRRGRRGGPREQGGGHEQDGARAGRSSRRSSARVPAQQGRDRAARKAQLRATRPTDRKYALRRWIGLAVAVLVGLGVLGGGLWAVLVFTGIANVQSVQVSGTLAVSQDTVLAAANVPTGVPLATLDTDAVAKRVAAVPGIGTVSVGRGWPHTVTIAVTERLPVALARTPQGVMLVDATGDAYQKAPDVPPVLPLLGFGAVGPADPATKAAMAVLAALPADLRGRVTTVDVTSSVQPSVRLGLGDKHVTIGSADRLPEKVAVLVPLLTRPGHGYDVSSPELPTVTP